MTKNRLILTASASLLVLAMPATAEAASIPTSDEIIARACQGHQGDKITPLRLGESLLLESGRIPSEFVADATSRPVPRPSDPGMPEITPAQVYSQALVDRLGQVESGSSHGIDPDLTIRSAIDVLRARLRTDQQSTAAPLHVSEPAPVREPWLFQAETPHWTLTCKAGDPEPTPVGQMEKFTAPAAFSLREKPEELPLLGDERRTAGAFDVTGVRERKTNADGSRKTDSKITVSGTAGLRLSPATSSVTTAYLFGQYQAERARTDPPPKLDPGKHQSDGDTHALETGVLITTQLMPNASRFKLFANIQGGAVFDFANHSNRLELRALLRPMWDTELGLCGLERYKEIIPALHLKTRCRIALDIQAARMLRRGTTPLGSFDTFLAAGAKVGIEAYLPSAKGMDLVGSIDYRILPVLHGKPNRIERLETSLKYRIWTSSNIGVDVGFTYTDGTNELSFEDEHKLTFGVGIIF
jgi:hypothetical protein